MRRSRLLLAVLLNLVGLVIVAVSFANMGSMANIFGVIAIVSFGAAFLLLRRERRRAALLSPSHDPKAHPSNIGSR